MIKSIFKTAVISALISVFLIGCLPLTNEVKKSTSDHTDVDNPITGPLTVSEEWPGKDGNNNPITYYINSIYTIKDGGYLVIKEGAIVKFGPKGGITVNNTGTLEGYNVIFTSYRDTRGRKLMVAGETAPAAGDWKQINISGGTGKFYGCEFSYGGNGCNTLYVCKNTSCGKARIDNCLFKNNSGSKQASFSIKAALYYDDALIYDEEINCVTNTQFVDNVWPLSMPAFFNLNNTNTFYGNEYNYVHINSYTIKTDTVWGKINVPYILLNTANRLKIYDGASLTINGGVNSDDPTVVCFGTKGITIEKGGELDLNDYIEFTNSPESSNTYYDGIYCEKKYKYRTFREDGTVSSTNNLSPILLESNGKITVKNYQPTSSNYTTGTKAEYYKDGIQTKNFYEEKFVN